MVGVHVVCTCKQLCAENRDLLLGDNNVDAVQIHGVVDLMLDCLLDESASGGKRMCYDKGLLGSG